MSTASTGGRAGGGACAAASSIAALGWLLAGLLAGLLADGSLQAQTLPTFESTLDVRLIELDVSVTDRQGVPIEGLEAADFRLALDDQVVEPDFFSEIRGAGRAAGDDASPLSVLLLVDSRTMRQASRARAFDELVPQLRSLLEVAGTRIRVVHYDGRIRLARDWTGEVADVESALAEIAAGPSGGESLDAREAQAQQALKDQLSNMRGGARERRVAMASIDALLGEMRAYAAAGVRDSEEILIGLQSVVRSLALIPGPKAVIYLTGGWAVRPGGSAMNRIQSALSGTSARDNDPAAARVSQSDTPGAAVLGDGGFMNRDVGQDMLRGRQAMEGFDLGAELDRLIAAAGSYRARFYPVMPPPGDAAAADARGRGRGAMEVSDVREGVLRLAELTGGRAFLSETALDGVLSDIAADLGHRYSLAVHTGGEPPVDDPRELSVRVKRRGAVVRFPHLHSQRSLEGRLLDLALAALDETAVANPHRLELGLLGQAPTSGGARQVQLALTFPIERLGLAAASGLHQASSQLTVVALDARGKPSSPQHLQVPLEVPQVDLEKARSSFYRAAIELQLAPGPHRVGVALWDAITRSASVVVHEIAVGGG